MVAAVTDQRALFYTQYNRCWEKGGFNSIYQRIQEIQKRADEQRLEMISSLSKLLKFADKEQFFQARQEAWELFRSEVSNLRKVEKEDLAQIRKVLEDSSHVTTLAAGDFTSVAERLEQFQTHVNTVYKNSLYPWLLALQNADKDWDPSGIVCRVWDYFSWSRADNVRAEIGRVCPKA